MRPRCLCRLRFSERESAGHTPHSWLCGRFVKMFFGLFLIRFGVSTDLLLRAIRRAPISYIIDASFLAACSLLFSHLSGHACLPPTRAPLIAAINCSSSAPEEEHRWRLQGRRAMPTRCERPSTEPARATRLLHLVHGGSGCAAFETGYERAVEALYSIQMGIARGIGGTVRVHPGAPIACRTG